MAWALSFDGVNDSARTPNIISKAEEWELHGEFIYKELGFVGYFGGGRGFGIENQSQVFTYYGSAKQVYWNIGVAVLAEDNVKFKFIFTSNGDSTYELNLQVNINNGGFSGNLPIYIGNTTFTSLIPDTFLDLGRRPNTIYTGVDWLNVQYIESSVTLNNWDADASDRSNTGQQPVLTDTVGGNNAVGDGFLTDGSAWIDLGGGETPITVTDSITNTSSSNNNDTVIFVGAFNINDSVVSSLSQSNNDSITLAALLTVNDSITSSSVANSSDTIKVVGEFSIAEVTTNSNVINNADSVNFAASLLVNDSTSSTNSTDNNDNVLLVGEFSIIDGQSITTTSANSDSVSFSSIVSVADSHTRSDSNNNNDSVLFVGQFNIDDIASSSSSISNADTIKLVGKVNVVDSKTNAVSSSNNDTVLIGTFTFSVNQETNITALYRSTNINAVTLSTNING